MGNGNKAGKKTWLVYLIGIIVWSTWWIVVYFYGNFKDKYFFSEWFWFPILLCLGILNINLFLCKRETDYGYNKEKRNMAAIEKNASYLILAITITIIAQQAFISKDTSITVYKPAVIFQLWALGSVILTFISVWIPSSKSSWLIYYRHIKTVFLNCAISFFIAGIIALWKRCLIK